MARIISRSAPRRRAAAIGAASLLALTCGRPAPPPGPAPRPSPTSRPATAAVRVVVLGDSLAAGLGLAADEAFPAVVEGLLRERGHAVEVVNAGVSGDTSAGGLARLEWVLQRPADILVVELGGNDALRGQELEATESNLREIVRRGRASGARVLLLGMDVPANYGPDYGGRFAALFERVAGEGRRACRWCRGSCAASPPGPGACRPTASTPPPPASGSSPRTCCPRSRRWCSRRRTPPRAERGSQRRRAMISCALAISSSPSAGSSSPTAT
ncbi:MAG: arylesterase [Thermoanaerobaculales bacterium]|nr:arylesterase [Thermoanaerobaculales bacterium]